MGILIHKATKIITQGISGKAGSFHTEQGIAYGSSYVGGVTPGKGGMEILGLPVFDTVAEARRATLLRVVGRPSIQCHRASVFDQCYGRMDSMPPANHLPRESIGTAVGTTAIP